VIAGNRMWTIRKCWYQCIQKHPGQWHTFCQKRRFYYCWSW